MSGVAAYIGHSSSAGARLIDLLATAQAPRGDLGGTVVGDRVGVAQLGSDGAPSIALDGASALAVDGGCALALDGRLDNPVELRAALIRAGFWPAKRAGSDAELLLAAWRGWRDSGLARCSGSFALAIADLNEETLTLARDELGSRPLYYTPPEADADHGTVVVASDLAALLAVVVAARVPDDRTVDEYLRYGVRPSGERTFFAGVRRVLPGEVVTVARHGTVTRHRYGHLRHDLDALDRHSRPVDEAARELVAAEWQRALRDSVGDTPVGVPAGFTGLAGGQEIPAPAEPPAPEQLAAQVLELVAAVPEPLSGPASFRQYRQLLAAGERIGVVLDTTGDRALRMEDAASTGVSLSELWWRRRFATLVREVGGHPVRSARLLGGVLGRHMDRPAQRTADPTADLIATPTATPSGIVPGPAPTAPRPAAVSRPPGHGGSRRQRVLDGLPAAFEFTDRISAVARVSVRQPLVDAELLRTVWSFDPIPSALPGAPGDGGGGRVAAELTDWLDGLSELLVDVFTAPSFATRGYFRQAEVLDAYRAYRTGANDVRLSLLWRLASVELWLRAWVDPVSVDPTGNGYPVNPGRSLISPDGEWARYPLRTQPVTADSDLAALATRACLDFFAMLGREERARLERMPWFLFVSGTAAAVAQGRAIPEGQMRPGLRARALARVDKVSPTAAELAVREVGRARLAAAVLAGTVGWALGRPGWAERSFAPELVTSRDPRLDAVPPADGSVLLPPEDPAGLADRLSAAVRDSLPPELLGRFAGTAIICADERRRVVLGHDTELLSDTLAAACVDNPLGQFRERTPMGIVVDLRPEAHKPNWAALNVQAPGARMPAMAAVGAPEPDPEEEFGGFHWEPYEERVVHPPWQHELPTLR
jgi:asparagine synthase (glutamine-hydrolysing)